MEIGIKEFYDNKSIFITGATGFIGKPLVEKLLRSCPGIKEIFVLVRPKKGLPAKERWDETTKDELFDILRKKRPTSLKKVKIIEGDVAEEGLGINEEQLKMLENVNIVIHSAASVRFDDPLKYVTNINVMGTKRTVDFALSLKHLNCFIHVSTAYSNCINEILIEEKVYPSIADWKKTCEIVNNIDPSVMVPLTAKYIHPFPNTYVFTKQLAEQVVNEVKNKLPVVIFRPSIVIPTYMDPFPGWIDNFNGPVGLTAAAGKGILRTLYMDENKRCDWIPVDFAVNAIIISVWKRNWSKNAIDVYNCAANETAVTNATYLKVGGEAIKAYPVVETLWYPNIKTIITKSYYWFKIKSIFTHYLAAILIDSILKATNQNPKILKIQIKIRNACEAVSYFTTKEWNIVNKNFQELGNVKSEEFSFSLENMDFAILFMASIKYVRRVLLKEPDSSLPEAHKKLFRLYIIDFMFGYTFMAAAGFTFYKLYLEKIVYF